MSDPVARLNAALSGRYAIERELGEGGMATVYLADDLKHNRNVALKVLKPELAAVVGAERRRVVELGGGPYSIGRTSDRSSSDAKILDRSPSPRLHVVIRRRRWRVRVRAGRRRSRLPGRGHEVPAGNVHVLPRW